MKYELRDYQAAAAATAEDTKNGILVLPTGSGKSLVIAAIAQATDGKTIVLQPTKEILEQNKAKMEAFGEWNIGVYSASCNRKDTGNVTFATIGSVIRHKELFADFDRVIVDECHGVNSKGGMYEEFLSHLDLPTVGLTATPYRLRHYRQQAFSGRGGGFGGDGERHIAESRVLTRTRPRIFAKISHVTQVAELFERGHLCPLEYTFATDYRADEIQGNSTGQGYNDQALMDYNEQHALPDRIADAAAEALAQGCRHVLAFTMFRKETARTLQYLGARGISCAEVSGETPKRERTKILAGFRDGAIKVVVNVGVLTTGFDFPELDCVILGRPTRSLALYYQMTGRGIRPAPGKTACHLIDLCDNVRRFGRVETFRLVDPMGGGRWRLESNAGYQTNRDLITGEDLEPENAENPLITWGRYGKDGGTLLREIPLDYIRWGATEMTKFKKWKKRFKLELARREAECHETAGTV